jgi:hypothetical protein
MCVFVSAWSVKVRQTSMELVNGPEAVPFCILRRVVRICWEVNNVKGADVLVVGGGLCISKFVVGMWGGKRFLICGASLSE